MINSTFSEHGPELDSKMTYAVVYGCIVVLGLPLNAVSLWILIRRHSLKSSSAVFMINLALSDLLLVMSLPMRVHYYATGSSPLGIKACTSIFMLFCSNMRSSTILITFIGVDRLLAVVYPMRARRLRTTSNAWKACSFVWLFILSINIPEGIEYSREKYQCNVTTCFELPPAGCQSTYRRTITVLMSVFVLVMLAVNVVSTAMVCWTLRRHLSNSVQINKINVILIFAVNLLMFIICFLPPSLALLLKHTQAIMPTVCLASVNCCLDPLLYYFSLDAFWEKKEDVEASPVGEQYTVKNVSEINSEIL